MSLRRHRKLLILFILAGIAGGVAWYLHQRELEDQQMAMWHEELRNRKDYTAETAPCSIRFERGPVGRVSAYDQVFRWHGWLPELASGSDDSEGEVWAEFYALEDPAAAAELLTHAWADLGHHLVRQRVWGLYFRDRPDEIDSLRSHHQVLLEAQDQGWQLRVSWLPTPHGVALVAPPQDLGQTIVKQSRLGEWRAIEQDAQSAWQWHTLDSGQHPQRDLYRNELHRVRQSWGHDPAQQRVFVERFEREHQHFYLIEAARDLGAGRVLILRRFGPVVGGGTLTRSMNEIATMASSLKCAVP